MMTLYWSSRSPYARKTMVMAHETGLVGDILLNRVDIAVLRPDPQVVALNPLGKIPVLVREDGSPLFDSGLICAYFHRLRPDFDLFPASPEAWLTALRRQVIGTGLMDLLVLGRAERLRPDGTRSDPHVAAYRRKFMDVANALESDASGLQQDAVSIGHIAIGIALDYADFRHPETPWRDGRPGLADWHDRFAQRPSMRATAFSEIY